MAVGRRETSVGIVALGHAWVQARPDDRVLAVSSQHSDPDVGGTVRAVLEVRCVQWASEKSRVEAILGRRPGVLAVDANAVAQTATVVFDPTVTSIVTSFRRLEEIAGDLTEPLRAEAPPDVVDRNHGPLTFASEHDPDPSTALAALGVGRRVRLMADRGQPTSGCPEVPPLTTST